MEDFDWGRVVPEDRWLAKAFGVTVRPPDLVIAPDGEPYLYRWHLVPRNFRGNCYFHIQVASDPERPLHDHPWDNTSVILAGGYTELQAEYPNPGVTMHSRIRGDVIARKARWGHRLILPKEMPYAMTLFTTGPHVKEWGFWIDGTWHPHTELVTQLEDGRSVFRLPEGYRDDN